MHSLQSMESGAMRVRGTAIALAVALLWASASAGNITIYWGQNGADADEASLAETCLSDNFEIVVVQYLLINGTVNSTIPELDLVGHSIDSLNAGIKSCQESGRKVFLSLYGAVASAAHADFLATYLWENFLGGESESRPLGDAVVDGIDFGYYEASAEHWDDLAKAISNLSTTSEKVYLSAAPECPYPDYFLQRALETGLFDYIWIQFIDNPTCEYDNGDASNLVNAWNQWINSPVETLQTPGFYLGLPAAPGFGSGYIEPAKLISDVLPKINGSAEYGGVTLWTKYWDQETNYSSIIKPFAVMMPSQVNVPTLASV